MENKIDKYIEIIENKKAEIDSLRLILKKHTTLNSKEISKNIEQLSQEILELQKTKFIVNLGELVEELASLNGLRKSELALKVKTNIKSTTNKRVNLNEILSKISLYNQSFLVNITVGNIYKCFYNFSTVLNNEDKFNNGTTFFENLRLNTSLRNGLYSNKLFVRNVYGLNFPIEIRQLTKEETATWYPAGLMKKAVQNCLDRRENIQDKDRDKN